MTATFKIGVNKGRARVWLDGKRLTEAGFTGGTTYQCQVTSYCIRCTLGDPPADATTRRVATRKVTGRPGGKPIIDILGRDVEDALAGAERVRVTFEPGTITIVAEATS